MKRLILALTFGAFAAGSASAQLRLTLDDAIQMALSENPTIKVADLDVERYDYVKKEPRGNLLPSLSASGEYTRAIEKSTMRGGISFGADNTFTGTASLSVPLFAPAVYRTLKLNRTQIASAVEAARSSRITLVAEVKKAFYNILLAEQSLATLEESRATIQRTVDDTKEKFEQGVASEYDYLPAQVELRKHGIGKTAYTNFSKKRARQVTKEDYGYYDYLLCADANNIIITIRITGPDVDGKIKLLLDFATDPKRKGKSISDPWYSGRFDETYRDVVSGCEGLLAYLKETGQI